VAARTLARRIAQEQGWKLGQEVGWQIRLERNFTPATRLLIATEGILTARLRSDPFLSDFDVVLLDEFHERSLHGDLALGMLQEARAARPELRLVVMSATLNTGQIANYLSHGAPSPCPVVSVPGRVHPLEISYAPGQPRAGVVLKALSQRPGDLLVFLPGMRDIEDLRQDLEPSLPADVEVRILHGSLKPEVQEAALKVTGKRRIILSTNIAETSLTVEGISTVVDSGLQKILRLDPTLGLDRLETERISEDSATQRAGRAGRLGPGQVWRLWDSRAQLRAQREPEIQRVDLSAPLLEIFSWGGSPRSFPWFEAPPEKRQESAILLLHQLKALEGFPPKLTPRGHTLAQLPLSPRLGTMLLEAPNTREAARLAAMLSEGRSLRGSRKKPPPPSPSDAWTLLDLFSEAPRGVHQLARQLESLVNRRRTKKDIPESGSRNQDLLRAILAAFPDRVARRRRPESSRLLLASGHGAELATSSSVRKAEWIVALDVRARQGKEALVHLASAIDPAWLKPTEVNLEHRLLPGRDKVRAFRVSRYHALILSEEAAAPDPMACQDLLVEELHRRLDQVIPPGFLSRVRFAGLKLDLNELVKSACMGQTRLPDFSLQEQLSFAQRRQLKNLAPETFLLPSGRSTQLEYRQDGTVMAAAKLQEVFGLNETPRLGPEGVPLLFSMLAPSGRSVQLTDDLESFWRCTYPEIRKELRGRYPKHPWPEDPWKAKATFRTKPRRNA
jgi:ATP-dependent helicase HrpB